MPTGLNETLAPEEIFNDYEYDSESEKIMLDVSRYGGLTSGELNKVTGNGAEILSKVFMGALKKYLDIPEENRPANLRFSNITREWIDENLGTYLETIGFTVVKQVNDAGTSVQRGSADPVVTGGQSQPTDEPDDAP